jgi:hypothetical protein
MSLVCTISGWNVRRVWLERIDDILMISPWKIELGEENGYPLIPRRKIQVPNRSSFLAQRILIHHERDRRDRAKDLLYMHDTIEVFSEDLGELRTIYSAELQPGLHANRVAGDGKKVKRRGTCRNLSCGAKRNL